MKPKKTLKNSLPSGDNEFDEVDFSLYEEDESDEDREGLERFLSRAVMEKTVDE